MKLYAPEYYKDFKCIADRCKHSCCVGWEIDVDETTLEKYKSLEGELGDTIRESIEDGETPHFKLCDGDRCPHLTRNGLCKIILGLSEDYICDICREHPRFYNDTARGKEVGLGIACEEACRLVLTSENYSGIVEIGELDGDVCRSERDFDALAEREKVFSILSNKSLTYLERLKALSREYGVSVDILDERGWRELFSSLEYLDKSHKNDFEAFSLSPAIDGKIEVYLERALAYFIYRHCTEAEDVDDFVLSLGLCLVLERLLASLCAKNGARTVDDIILPARIISEELEYSEENAEEIKLEFAFR